MWYAIGKPGESIRQCVTSSRGVIDILADVQPGEVYAEVEDPQAFDALDDEGVPYRREVTLDKIKADRKREARAYRDAREAGGVAAPRGRVDTDQASREKITGAASAAGIALALSIPFDPIPWPMQSGNPITHSAQQLVAMGMTVVLFVKECREICDEIVAAIDAAPDAAAVAAIDVTAGYRP
jgi:hypothetical protein